MMQADSGAPFSVLFCNALIRVAAPLVPAARRQEWRQEWTAEIWHRWQFLRYAGEWNRREALRLIRNCAGVFPDAACHFATQEAVQSRVRGSARSPWTCLGALAILLLIVAIFSSGLPATRDMLFSQTDQKSGALLFLWLHPITGGGDRGLPPDAVPDWANHSRLLESVAAFNVRHQSFSSLVITSDPALFHVLRSRPLLGEFPAESGMVLDYQTWVSRFHADPKAIGAQMVVNGKAHRITAVLPAGFRFLSRQPSVYLTQKRMTDPRVMVIARAKPGVTEPKLQQELVKISEDFSYYFFGSDLRLGFLRTEVLAPLRFFGVAVLVSGLILLMASKVRLAHIRAALGPPSRRAALRRALFFSGKTVLALLVVFVACLEWSRSPSSILLASLDPASGPLLLWLYIVGAMGVFFWSLADQRARCRVCLRLLCFPVRIGCPGCLLLDWSGTELACTEGHGILHVPHLAPCWEDESQHWISLDESWRELFAHSK